MTFCLLPLGTKSFQKGSILTAKNLLFLCFNSCPELRRKAKKKKKEAELLPLTLSPFKGGLNLFAAFLAGIFL